MSENFDVAVGDTTPDQPAPDAFIRPPEPSIDLDGGADAPAYSIDEILDMARLPESRTRICLRGDLQAEHDRIIDELSGLVNAQGEVGDDPEASVGEQTAAGRAQALSDQLQDLEREMRKSSAWFHFRAMDADEFVVFQRQHYPKKSDDLRDFNARMIAECAISPAMTVEQVTALRGKLGPGLFGQLVMAAREINTKGGLDIPKSPVSSLSLGER